MSLIFEENPHGSDVIKLGGVAMKDMVYLAMLFALASSPIRADQIIFADGFEKLPVTTSSFELIDEALAAGELDPETAVEYKAFALFKDPRLPAAYQGDDSNVLETDTFDDIYEVWASLSPAGQQIIEPFLIPPAYVGSWANPVTAANPAEATTSFSLRKCYQPVLDPNWASKPATNDGLFKVWYDTRVAGQATLASTVLAAATNDVWPALVDGLQMRAPLSDAANAGCNGGDGRLDIYLGDMASFGQTAGDYGANLPVDYAWKHRPVFILLNHNLSEAEIKGTLAHEFMHASQWAYPVAGIKLAYTYPWLKEATAQWAIDYVYPTQVNNFEQKRAPAYMDRPDTPLNTETLGLGHVYGSYLFFQFLAKTLTPSVIKDIWEKTVQESDELDSVDTTIPGGFTEQWPKFAKLLWNQDPVNGSSFEDWDSLTKTPALYGNYSVKLNGQPQSSENLNGNIDRLSIQYYHFAFADSNIRSVRFLNHFLAVNAVNPYKVSVQAFYRKVGSIWQWEHWSDGGLNELVKPFCLDVVAERLDELVIVISNDSPTEDVTDLPVTSSPRLSVSNVGCWRWHGTSSVTTHTSSVSTNAVGDETAEGTVTFERESPDPQTNAGNTVLFWVHNGSVTGASTAVDDNCTFSRSGVGPMAMFDGSLTVDLGINLGDGTQSRDVFMFGSSSLSSPWTMVCPPDVDTSGTGDYGWLWLGNPSGGDPVTVKADGSIQGSHTETLTGDVTGWKTVIWNFTPQRE